MTEPKTSQSPTKPVVETTELRLPTGFWNQVILGGGNVEAIAAGIIRERHSISLDQFRIMATVFAMGAVSPSTIAQATSVHKVRISRALADLYRRGLSRETADMNDGRVRRVALTPKGTSTFHKAVDTITKIDRALEPPIGENAYVIVGAAMTQLMGLTRQSIEAAIAS